MIRLAKSPITVSIPSGSTIEEAKEIKANIMETKEGKSNRFYNATLSAQHILDNALEGYIITAGYNYRGNGFRNNDNVQAFGCVIIDVDDKQGFTYDDFVNTDLFQYTAVTYPSTSNTSNMDRISIIFFLMLY